MDYNAQFKIVYKGGRQIDTAAQQKKQAEGMRDAQVDDDNDADDTVKHIKADVRTVRGCHNRPGRRPRTHR